MRLKKLYNFFFDELLKSSWRSVVLLWKPMAGWTLIVYLLFTALSAPLLAFILDWSVFRGDRLFVGNEDLLRFFISPVGFVYLFSLILLTLIGIIIRYAGIFQMVRDHLLGERVSVRLTVIRIAARVHILLKICAITIMGFIVSLIPLAIGLGVVYAIFLTEFDINYYWYSTPPEWYRALTFGGILTVLWGLSLLLLTATLMPALPAYLEGKKTLREAIREVWYAPLSHTFRFLKVVSFVAVFWFFFRITTDAILLSAFLYLADWAVHSFESLRAVAIVAGGYIFTSISAGIIISFFGFTLISVIITKFYFSFSRPAIMPETPGFKKLTQKTIRLFTWWTKPLRAAVLILIILSGSVATSFLITYGSETDAELLVISHRANAMGAPENSLPALDHSIELGIDFVEIDVQLTSDGTVVILHDEDLMRVTGDPRQIADITAGELSELRLLTDREYPDSELHVPTLAEYLEGANGRIGVMIELKYYGFDPELAEKTIELVREFEMEDQVLVKSLNFRAVEQMRTLAPDIGLGYVSAVAMGDLSRLPIHFLSVNQANATSELISRAQQEGMGLFVWTVNSREGMIDAILKGVNGIITDYPELSIAIIEDIGALSTTERLLLQLGLHFLETQAVLTGEWTGEDAELLDEG
ncbi:MAG: hypothetical protein JJU37_14290 [Balneolaceae bacterium]|nr:hypothetical protein [Balneolaceae bacterium]